MKKVILLLSVAVLLMVFSGAAGAEEVNKSLLYEQQKKDPFIGALSSIVIPGGGYYYAGEYENAKIKGGMELLGLLLYVLVDEKNVKDGLSLSYLGLKAYNVYDSYQAVNRYNEALRKKLQIEPVMGLDEGIGLSVAYNF